MAHIEWDKTGERRYETGVDHGVLYQVDTQDGTYKGGVAWNGLTTVTESPSGAEPTKLYADNIKYLTLMSTEEFGGTIEAYTYPEEFGQNDGTVAAQGAVIGQQPRKTFGLCYRTQLGNDTAGQEYGYKLHLVYGCLAKPSEKAYATVNDSPEAITFSWEFSTTPVAAGAGRKPTSVITVDSTKADPTKLKELEDLLYGANAEAVLPLPEVVIQTLTP